MAEDDEGVSSSADIDEEMIFAIEDGDGEEGTVAQPCISRVSVSRLFGRYSYVLPVPTENREPGRLMLLHGENGSGKTTILKLIWNILSTAEDRGHKSAVARTPFHRFEILFSDGRVVIAEKESKRLVGSFTLTVSGPGVKPATARFVVDKSMSVTPTIDYGFGAEQSPYVVKDSATGRLIFVEPRDKEHLELEGGISPTREVMGFLRDLSTKPPVLLADDRGLHSDHRITRARKSARTNDSERLTPTERIAEELQAALLRLNDRVLALTSKGQVSGFREEASIYIDVLRRLGTARVNSPQQSLDVDGSHVEQLIQNLSNEVPRFAEFGLVSKFDPEAIRGLLDRVPPISQQAAYDIILPYLESLQARLTALNEAERLIRSFVTHANKYLTDKNLVFGAGQGFRVISDYEANRVLRPLNLSSGERQMLLLLCNAILSRWESRLFLIDEPELSLGVIWQRRILSSLLDLTDDTNIQFIVATHSIEMATANSSSLVRLVDIGGEF
ncbi:AAA family ATPase [Nocardia sp. NPDC059180]|uniref:AAA family ATPase n=1 Tax=Nocardia sp. NPDC059180 TaxID=3346761 RepID=UPI003696E384